MWLARNKINTLGLYFSKPVNMSEYGIWEGESILLSGEFDIFPDITYENSPREIAILPIMNDEEMHNSVESMSIHCRICSNPICMEPMGERVCEHYNKKIGKE